LHQTKSLPYIQRLAPIFILLPAAIAYIPALIAKPLLDEQFLLAWLNYLNLAPTSEINKYLAFHGFNQIDMWGPLTLFSLKSFGLFGPNLFIVLKLTKLAIHLANAFFVFILVYYICADYIIALVSELIFSLYPLNAEAVAWLGGYGAELSVCFFLISFIFYLKAQNQFAKINWYWLIAAIFSLALAIACNAMICLNVFIFVLYEIAYFLHTKPKPKVENFCTRLALSLLMVFIPIIYLIATNSLSTVFIKSIQPHLTGQYIMPLIKHLVIPINEVNWHGYAPEYRFLYFLSAIPICSLIITLIKRKDIRCLFSFAFIATFLAALPYVGHAMTQSNLYGSRYLYFAIFPLSILIAILFCSIYYASKMHSFFQNKHKALTAITVLFLLAANIFYFRHLFNETSAKRVAGKVLSNIQKSLSIVASKEGSPYLFVRDIPEYTSHAPAFNTQGMICLNAGAEADKGLLSAKIIPDGRLQKALHKGQYTGSVLRWDKDFQSLLPIDITLKTNLYPEHSSAQAMQAFFVPGFVFYKNASYDASNDCIYVETNSNLGPIISLNTEGLSPITGNFLYLDLNIETGNDNKKAPVEMYWQTRLHTDYDNKERKLTVEANVNDKIFHRLYFPLRTIGWSTNSAATVITLGFPAHAKVAIKSMGLIASDKLIPDFSIAEENKQAINNKIIKTGFDYPYANYPNIDDLGLLSLNEEADGMTVSHNAQNIIGATGVVMEISKADKPFNNINGNTLSNVTGRTVALNGSLGKYKISFADFPSKGVYSFRVIAIDKNGEFIGNFSDAIVTLIRNSNIVHAQSRN
jgi:heme/copper-type cytochrome/quinol oxidase subunit 2